jgi:hypothetical protein
MNEITFKNLPQAVKELSTKLDNIEKRKKTTRKKRSLANKRLTASKMQFVSKFVIRGIFEILKAIAVHIIFK